MEILETLRLVVDPELEINIIDMGLVYSITLKEEEKTLNVEMTLSSPNCPMGASIVGSVQNCLEHYFPHYIATVALVWEPAWSYDLIREEGRRLLGR